LLHGTWMGHPLHPVLTDITIGAWIFSFVFDLLSLPGGSKNMQQAADTLLDLGNTSALATAASGLTEFSTIPTRSMATAATHGTLNALALSSSLFSSVLRKKGDRRRGIWLSSVTSSLLFFTAWLGGEMAYKYKVGASKIPEQAEPYKWHPTIPEQDLPEMTPKRVEAGSAPVLLYRYQGQVFAIGAVCGHEGGHLENGTFEGYCVTCPLHQSVYDLRDGSVVHGPGTYAEPVYEVQVRERMLEVRLRETGVTKQAAQVLEGEA
jgi:nitrite reductase/ring-hydroxylating ferredoxin subunit/uncharacterized membrane protein